MLARLRSRAQEEKGFTLIELLVVVLIIGILAAIAIPAFLGQKKGAQDSNAKSLLRNAAIAMESFYSDNQSFDTPGSPGTQVTEGDLLAIEPNIKWEDDTLPAATPPLAKDNQLMFHAAAIVGTPNDAYILNTRSASGTYFSYSRDENAKTAKCKGTAILVQLTTPSTCTVGAGGITQVGYASAGTW